MIWQRKGIKDYRVEMEYRVRIWPENCEIKRRTGRKI